MICLGYRFYCSVNPNINFTITFAAGIPSQGQPKKEVFNKKTSVYPII